MSDSGYDLDGLAWKFRSIVGEEDVLTDEPLSEHTTFEIGGPADLYVMPEDIDELRDVIDLCREKDLPFFVLGRGSDLLVSDEGYRGVIVGLADGLTGVDVDEKEMTCEAGVTLKEAAEMACELGLTGLEFACGIPGTVGGAVSMNAGMRYEWIGARVSSVVTVKPREGMRRYQGTDIEWDYRWCSLPADEVILEAAFALTPADRQAIATEMESRLARRRLRQPMGLPSCGSVFRNPPKASAGRLVEECGLAGLTVGGAQISDKHANFIVNRSGASAQDVVTCMRRMHDEVKAAYDIDLTPEVKLLGFEE